MKWKEGLRNNLNFRTGEICPPEGKFVTWKTSALVIIITYVICLKPENATIISTKPSKLSCIYSIFLSFPGAVHRSIWEKSNTILYRQQKPLQVLYITVSNLKNDNCTGKGQFDENNNTMPLQMFYYNVRKGEFLQRRKNNTYNTDKLP